MNRGSGSSSVSLYSSWVRRRHDRLDRGGPRVLRRPSPAPSRAVGESRRRESLTGRTRPRAKAKPYEEAQYRTFPVVGSRVAIWAVAQLHLLFAAFVLAVPIFAFIVEAIGYKTGDLRYDRLATSSRSCSRSPSRSPRPSARS